VQRRPAALAGGFDDLDRPQAVGGPLREQQAASEERSQLAGAEWLSRKRRQRTHDVVGVAQFNPGVYCAKVSRSRVACSPAHRHRPSGTYVVLAQQQHFDGQVGMGQ
jgi:hypothetical protein